MNVNTGLQDYSVNIKAKPKEFFKYIPCGPVQQPCRAPAPAAPAPADLPPAVAAADPPAPAGDQVAPAAREPAPPPLPPQHPLRDAGPEEPAPPPQSQKGARGQAVRVGAAATTGGRAIRSSRPASAQ